MTTPTLTGGLDTHCTTRMTAEQENHLKEIKEQFAADVDAKYRAGVREHGGNIWELTPLKLIEEAMKEAVDQYVYLATARDRLLSEAGFPGRGCEPPRTPQSPDTR